MIEINEEIKELLFLGPVGTYSEIAKNQFLTLLGQNNILQTPFATVKKIIEYIDNNPNTAGIIPIEIFAQKPLYL